MRNTTLRARHPGCSCHLDTDRLDPTGPCVSRCRRSPARSAVEPRPQEAAADRAAVLFGHAASRCAQGLPDTPASERRGRLAVGVMLVAAPTGTRRGIRTHIRDRGRCLFAHEHGVPDCFAIAPDAGTERRDGYYAGGGAVSREGCGHGYLLWPWTDAKLAVPSHYLLESGRNPRFADIVPCYQHERVVFGQRLSGRNNA